MSEPIGRSLPVSLGRRIVCDFLDVSTTVPTVSIQKAMNVAEVVRARRSAAVRPSWCSIFTKAYAMTVAARPELRRAFLTMPWERLYEYRKTKADIVIEARIGLEDVIVTVPLPHPQARSLLEIDRHLAWCKENPLQRVRAFRRAFRMARLPAFLRRRIMRLLLNGSGWARAHYFGTFGVTSVGNWGVESLRPLSPWITLLHYGLIDTQGNITIRLTYDHRVLDGSGPAQALKDLEHFLKSDILLELRALPSSDRREGLARAS